MNEVNNMCRSIVHSSGIFSSCGSIRPNVTDAKFVVAVIINDLRAEYQVARNVTEQLLTHNAVHDLLRWGRMRVCDNKCQLKLCTRTLRTLLRNSFVVMHSIRIRLID